ncbi:MAG: hypothetical protein LKJ90_06320 [Faecalibacterium sp.]|jgi:hypothetical protein|nr:hypothetical protein [Faecalibacterium sp.]
MQLAKKILFTALLWAKRLLYLAVFLGLVFVGFWFLNSLYKARTQNDDSVDLFYELPRDSADVVCIGSSHVYCGINPGLFWEDSGGAACALLSSSQQSTRVSYYYLQEALTRQHPKVIYIDVACMAEGNFYAADLRGVKVMRPTRAKFAAMRDMMAQDSSYVLWDFFNLTADSSRWQDLTEENWEFATTRPYEKTRGFAYSTMMFTQMVPGDEANENISDEDLAQCSLPDLSVEYLNKMFALGKQYPDTQIVFIRVPMYATNWDDKMSGEVGALAEAAGYPYLDLNGQVPGLDYPDFFHRSHANFSGAEKITAWLADYTIQQYALPTHLDDPAYAGYAAAAEYYHATWAELKRAYDAGGSVSL